MGVSLGIEEQELKEALGAWLEEHLPAASDLSVASVSLPGNGASNLTGIVDATWTEGGSARHEDLVLRTLSPNASQLYETYDLAKQYRIMECLAPTAIRVPRLVAFEADPSLLGREFYVMHNTGGRAVPERPSYHESGWFADLHDDERRRLWLQGVDAIAAIHGLDWQALGLDFVAAEGTGDHLDRFVSRHSEHLRWMERRNEREYPQLRRVFDWLEQHVPRETPISLLWADAKLGNVMIEGSDIVGVLDWEHCTIGPNLYDLANWMIFDRLMSTGARVPRAAGLPERDETVRRYEEATGHPATDLTYFELFSAVRLANVTCGMAPDLIAAGLVPPEFATRNAGTIVLDKQLDMMGLRL